MELGSRRAPAILTSRRRVRYRDSAWLVHSFQVWSGDLVCRGSALRMRDSLLLSLSGPGEEALAELALGLPDANSEKGLALATTLVGEADGQAAALARRLARVLRKPVYVVCGVAFDRFSLPLVERGVIAEIKSRPECF